MMAGMTTIMTLVGHGKAVHLVLAVIAGALAVLFLVSAGIAVFLTSRRTPGRQVPLPVAADVIMTVGMAAMTMVIIT
jgi:hypothetical protein